MQNGQIAEINARNIYIITLFFDEKNDIITTLWTYAYADGRFRSKQNGF